MKLPSHIRRALEQRGDFERQRIALALLLQPPSAKRPFRGHAWCPPPMLSHEHAADAPGLHAYRSALKAAREHFVAPKPGEGHE